jgi:xanthine dehydrogenase small subunit
MKTGRSAMMPRNPRRGIRFVLDDEIVEVDGIAPTTTVLEYLRDVRGLTGTKEGCAEGDCGACTVVLGELSPDGQRIDYRAVNSCIRFLPTIDGKELVTVESLQAERNVLHPVQQAMVDHHASQCGFCTPGFVMSLFGLYLQNEKPQRTDVVDALAGNLCRCTGYRPIIAAGCSMADYPTPAKWSREDAQSEARRQRLHSVQSDEPLSSPTFHAPRSVDELAALLEAEPASLILAGGTDVGLWVTKQLRELPPMIHVGAVPELKQIREHEGGLHIGAAASLTDAWRAILRLYPQLLDLVQRFASPPVCNSGTICGNIANGSPVGDSMPILIALDAQLELRLGTQVRTLPLDRFYLGYQRKDLRPGEFVVSVTVPTPAAGWRIASYKVSKRFDQDIAAVCAAFAIQLDGNRVRAARIAFGGMAAIPARAPRTEAALKDKEWNEQTIDAAIAALATDFKPLTDMRASSEYRQMAAAQLLRRFYQEQRGQISGTAFADLRPVTTS